MQLETNPMSKIRFYTIALLLSLLFYNQTIAQNGSFDDRKKELLISVDNSQYGIKPISPQIDLKQNLSGKGLMYDELNKTLSLEETFKENKKIEMKMPADFVNDFSIQKIFPDIKINLVFRGGQPSNRYNDPYFRYDGFTGLFFDRSDASMGAGFAIGGLNLHDPKSWFTEKERKRRAETARRITQWVYTIEEK